MHEPTKLNSDLNPKYIKIECIGIYGRRQNLQKIPQTNLLRICYETTQKGVAVVYSFINQK